MIEKPKVIIDNEVFRKIMYWVNKSSYEVSGLGTLTLEENQTFRVRSAMLLPQKNGSAHTDIEPEDVGKLMYAMRAEPGELRFWWHSHVDMGVFWSGTDMDTIKKLGQGGWFLSSVFNKKKEIRSAYYAIAGSRSPWGEQPLFLDELDTKVTPFVEPHHAEWDAEYNRNVTVQTHSTPDYSSYGYWDDDSGWVYGGRHRSHDFQSGFYGKPTIANPVPERKRPPGVSKREWKKLKREQRLKEIPNLPAIVKPDEVDGYGLTQEERSFLATMGWDQHEIDEAMDLDITPSEMLGLASRDMLLDDVMEMERNGWTLGDILKHFGTPNETPSGNDRADDDGMLVNDDIPVADRGKAGAV